MYKTLVYTLVNGNIFVAMATGVGRGKMQLAAFDGPSPKTPL